MNTSGALDLGISLFFVYLLTSLLCTSACELVASLLSLRQKMLADAVSTLLRNEKLSKAVFEHPLIRGITHGKRGVPSYVPKELFAAATLDVLSKPDGADVSKDVHAAVLALVRGTKAEAKVEAGFQHLEEEALQVKEALGRWFDDSMSRAAGAYKRQSQRVVLVVACVLVAALNIDTISIARALWLRPELRTAIAQQAAEYVAKPNAAPVAAPEDPKAAFDAANDRLTTSTEGLQALGLPLGWPEPAFQLRGWNVAAKLLGWLLTVLAVSLGAPFWFDLLGKLVNIRSAGRKPA